jgi:hypothetical protein
MVGLAPASVTVTDTAYKPAALVGGAAGLGDESDATYAEQWLSIRGGVGDGPTIVADFDPYAGGGPTVALRLRFEVSNELGATGTRFLVAAHQGGLEVGLFHTPDAPADFPSVPATDTIYDISDWTFEQTSLTTTLKDALAGGLEIRIRRLEETTVDGDWMIRVYELNMLAASVSPPQLRKYPNPTGLGVGPTRHWPRPRRGITGIR